MAKGLSGTDSKPNEEMLIDEADGAEFDAEEPQPPPRPVSNRDPDIRRKIEDRLERVRLREELGIYDDSDLADF